MEAVLVTNGPGELYTWTLPVLRALREADPALKISISLVPDQFTSGNEATIASTFGADTVTSARDFLTFMATGRRPAGLGDEKGFVISLGGNTRMALQLAGKLGYPAYRYSFEPYWNRKLRKLFVHSESAFKRARLLGAPRDKLELIGNLVADAVQQTEPVDHPGHPHVMLLAGSRDVFSVVLIPFMIGLTDFLGPHLPNARFVWPVVSLLKEETLQDGIAGTQKEVLGGLSGQRQGDMITTPGGYQLEMVNELTRHAHMRAATVAVTIPGTNTLELGIAGVPSVVMLPMNKPEVIPLEGIGHWLGMIPGVGTFIKRRAVKLFVEGLKVPVSLPNRFSGEDLMIEVKGKVSVEGIGQQVLNLLSSPELQQRRTRLLATMPQSGAADRLVKSVLSDIL